MAVDDTTLSNVKTLVIDGDGCIDLAGVSSSPTLTRLRITCGNIATCVSPHMFPNLKYMYLSTNALKAFEFVAPTLAELVVEIDPTHPQEKLCKILEDVLTFKVDGAFRYFPSVARLEIIYNPLAPGASSTFTQNIARERASPRFQLIATPL